MEKNPDKLPLPLPQEWERKRFFRWFFLGLLVFLIYQLALILSLFSDVIIWAGSLTLVFWPAYWKLQQKLPGRPNLAAALCTTGVLVLVLVPTVALFSVVIAQSALLYPVLEEWLLALQTQDNQGIYGMLPEFLQQLWSRISGLIQSIPALANVDFRALMLENANSVSAMLTGLGAATARNILVGLVNLVLILTLMYFCFRDGTRFLAWFFEVIPMEASHAEAISRRVYQMVTAVIRGALVTSSVQGLLATIGYLLAGVPLAVFFGVLTGFFALVPVVGAGLIWLPVGLLMMSQSPGWGVFILVWGFFVVSLIDNLLKPILIGSQTRMPILLIFCAMIGGANVYGVTGFIIGPILISVLMACIKIYREMYWPANAAESD